jgi:hypothetical protein
MTVSRFRGIEACGRSREATEVHQQHTAARQEHERERDLGDDDPLRRASGAGARRPSRALAEHIGRRGFRRLPQRRQAGDYCGDERRPHRERKDGPVDRHILRARDVVGRHADDHRREGHAQEDSAQCTKERDRETFDEVLFRQLTTAGAERDAHRCFTRASDRTRQQEAGSIRARNQEQQRVLEVGSWELLYLSKA